MDARALGIAALGGLALFLFASRRAEAASFPQYVPDAPEVGFFPETLELFAPPGGDFPQWPATVPRAPATPIYDGGAWDWLPPPSVEPAPVYAGGEWDYLPAPSVEPAPVYAGGEWDFLPDPYVNEPAPFDPYTVGEVWPYQPEAPAMPADQPAANLLAIKAAIAAAEGTDPNAYGWNPYGVTVGYEFEIDDFSAHPASLGWPGNRRAGVLSTAAGKYQFLGSTWNEAANALGLADFGPASQEAAADWLILVKRKAGPEIAAGDLAGALAKLSWEWASLPPGRYGQPLRSYDWIAQQADAAGGAFA
jgi:muramidase (phage lysozyme)